MSVPHPKSKTLTAKTGLFTAMSLFASALAAQQISVPRQPLPAQSGDPAMRVFDAQHLKDMPYNGSLPKPIFPSTDRTQRTFVVEYVYDYAYSAYKPEVPVPIVAALQAKRDTPEDALISFFSSMRTGDFEAWVNCWDDNMQKTLRDGARDKKQGAAYWQNIWKSMFANKPVFLVDRVETIGYVILDTRFGGAGNNTPFPNVFKFVQGKWLASNDLFANPLFFNIPPTSAGTIVHTQPFPVSQLSTESEKQQVQAQSDFIRYHDARESINHAGQ